VRWLAQSVPVFLCNATFEENGGKTLLVMHDVYPSKEALDATLASGMEPGMRETLEQLALRPPL
jgi:hypothetical protein